MEGRLDGHRGDVAASYLKEHVALHCKPGTAKLYRSVVKRSSCLPTATLPWSRLTLTIASTRPESAKKLANERHSSRTNPPPGYAPVCLRGVLVPIMFLTLWSDADYSHG